jgi:hypothetical protein
MELTPEQAPGLSMDIKGKEFAPVLSVTKGGTAGPGGPYSDTGQGQGFGCLILLSSMCCVWEGSPRVPPASQGCKVCAVHWLPVEAVPTSRVSSPS